MHQTSHTRYSRLRGIPKLYFNGQINASQKGFGKQIKALDARLKQLDEVEPPQTAKEYTVALAGDVSSHARLIARVDNIKKTYERPVIKGINFEVRGNERVHVSGPNGSGKSTLLKIIAGLIEPTSGTVTIGPGVGLGYFSQDADGLDHHQSGFENLRSTGADSSSIYREARSLGLIETELQRKSSELSRGQQAKLGFAKLLLSPNQLLVLDEPTNHLDIATRESIESALRQYQGAILVASHDDYFLESIGISREYNVRTDGESL